LNNQFKKERRRIDCEQKVNKKKMKSKTIKTISLNGRGKRSSYFFYFFRKQLSDKEKVWLFFFSLFGDLDDFVGWSRFYLVVSNDTSCVASAITYHLPKKIRLSAPLLTT